MAENPSPLRMGPTFEDDWPGASARATECVMNTVLTGDRIVEQIARLLRPFRLTPAQAQVLSIVHGAGAPLPHTVIAARLLVSRGTVSWLVDALEERGLVQRITHPEDRRTILVGITVKGEDLLQQYRPLIHRFDREVVADLSPAEQEILIELLGRLQARLNHLAANLADESATGG